MCKQSGWWVTEGCSLDCLQSNSKLSGERKRAIHWRRGRLPLSVRTVLMACEIFPGQESNSCPLHWQADSQPVDHQGSPLTILAAYLLPTHPVHWKLDGVLQVMLYPSLVSAPQLLQYSACSVLPANSCSGLFLSLLRYHPSQETLL